MTDAELLIALLRQEAPAASIRAVADRMHARHRDCPGDGVLAACARLADAAVRCVDSDASADWVALRAAADVLTAACIVSKSRRG